MKPRTTNVGSSARLTAPGTLAVTVGLTLAAIAGGGGCSADKSAPGTACVVQSDCPSPLACSYGRCHVACREARDCGAGQTCVSGPSGQICLLVEESSCALNSMCPLGLFCAQDLKCRSQCEEARDCPTASQSCVLPDKVCAEPGDLSDGRLIAPGGSGGAGGGMGGAGPGTGGTGGTGPIGGSSGMGGASGAAGSGGTAVLDCGTPESAPNETVEQASPAAVNTPFAACLQNKDDHDYYRFTVPQDPAGGYVQIEVTQPTPNLSLHLRVLTASDTAVVVDNVTPTEGQANYVYAAVNPGASYFVDVSPYSFRAASGYTLSIKYTALADTYEPNDSRFDAKPISLATPVSAYVFSGFTSKVVAANDDYYKVSLAAGMVTVTVDVFPTDASPQLWLYDGLGATVKNAISTTLGSGLSISAASIAAGDYYVRVGTYGGYDKQSGKGIDLPDNFTRPYHLMVTQP